MKLVQFKYSASSEARVGYLQEEEVVDLNQVDPSLPTSLLSILQKDLFERIRQISATKQKSVPLDQVTLTAPIQGMDKVICIGLNYRDHCKENKVPPPAEPMFFSKFSSTIIGPDQPARLRTDVTQNVDYEVELAAVIGKKATNVTAEEAHHYILGYTVAQDLGARDWQEKNGGQVLLAKSMDTFCPIGPCIVTGDEVGDPYKLDIRCVVNGDLRQTSNTCQLVHRVPKAVERLTSLMTLLPGDVILTGTPGGVGMARRPPEYLRPGDVIESQIERIGVLTTKIERF